MKTFKTFFFLPSINQFITDAVSQHVGRGHVRGVQGATELRIAVNRVTTCVQVLASIGLLCYERKESPAHTAHHIYDSIVVKYWDFLLLGRMT